MIHCVMNTHWHGKSTQANANKYWTKQPVTLNCQMLPGHKNTKWRTHLACKSFPGKWWFKIWFFVPLTWFSINLTAIFLLYFLPAEKTTITAALEKIPTAPTMHCRTRTILWLPISLVCAVVVALPWTRSRSVVLFVASMSTSFAHWNKITPLICPQLQITCSQSISHVWALLWGERITAQRCICTTLHFSQNTFLCEPASLHSKVLQVDLHLQKMYAGTGRKLTHLTFTKLSVWLMQEENKGPHETSLGNTWRWRTQTSTFITFCCSEFEIVVWNEHFLERVRPPWSPSSTRCIPGRNLVFNLFTFFHLLKTLQEDNKRIRRWKFFFLEKLWRQKFFFAVWLLFSIFVERN